MGDADDPAQRLASMGPGVFYSWNEKEGARFYSRFSLQWGQEFFTPGIMGPMVKHVESKSFNGARSFLLLEFVNTYPETERKLYASMGPGVFYSWNEYAAGATSDSRPRFNGARSFLLLESLAPKAVRNPISMLQWGQEFFTPGMKAIPPAAKVYGKASMGPGVFYSWNN